MAVLLLIARDGYASVLVQEILPNEANSAIKHFNAKNIVLYDTEKTDLADLVVFLPGTHGRPLNDRVLLNAVAGFGFVVIGLEYDDEPAVIQICPQDPNPNCSASFRENRIFGSDVAAAVHNDVAESIVGRLSDLLQYLAEHDSGGPWRRFLSEQGGPKWTRIIICGFSQGAGMAAYIAKRLAVERVVLFSGPWDYQRSPQNLAPWLFGRSATPADRWFASMAQRERFSAALSRSYQVLGVPKNHIVVCTLPPPATGSHSDVDVYHVDTIRNQGYEPYWRTLFIGNQ